MGVQAGVQGGSAGWICRAEVQGGNAGQECRAGMQGGSAGRDCRAGMPSGNAGQECKAGVQGGNATIAKVRRNQAAVSSVTLLAGIDYAPEQQLLMTAEGSPGE